ncbi:uncharacterized protein F5147DRAFT_780694 [Suillus discolor]|uniref:Fungal-type protein kinase domain-containing protein n=1 Tax=Suillus discolor TaxID=1912936 RepID=A0A9P7JMJ2_9AGAM|nr:uncharacterized protein F5147DRAFT_780694 [Suillus discolor]KAG2089230.1 hypothetical protein F5147DRAFT_780694 [Suillus discolor]
MAPADHSKTVDFGIKLASLMSAPRVSDMPTMDILTDLELNHLIVEEEEPADSTQPLSYLLSRIFRTFTIDVPDVTELQVLLHKIRYRDTRLHVKFAHLDEQSLVPLYDEDSCRWNWALPRSHRESGIDQLPELEEIGDGEENSGANKEFGSGSSSPSVQQHTLEVDATTDDTSQKSHTLEDIFSSFFNATCGAVVRENSQNSTRPVKDDEMSRKPDLALLDDVEARWDTIKAVCELTSQPYTPSGTIGKTLDSKAYLLLRRQPWRQFVLLLSLTNEYRELQVHMYDHAGGVMTSPNHIDEAPNHYLHILSSVVFGHIECIGYDPSINIFTKTLRPAQLENPIFRPSGRRQVTLDQVHGPQMDGANQSTASNAPNMVIDAPESDLEMDPDTNTLRSELDSENIVMDPPQLEIPKDPLRQPFSELIGRITVNNHVYDILELIFSSQGLVGQGTVCYLARRDEEEYIIKDHWVLGRKDAVLNKVNMLQEMKGVHGVPELVEYWLVEITPREVDETVKYRYKIFKSIKGTSRTHLRLVLKPRARPLHALRTKVELVGALQDIAKIQQTAVEERGILHRDCSLNNTMIWDDGSQKYAIGGTGTLPFMSRSLLWQLSEAVGDPATSVRSWKAKLAMHSLAMPPPLVLHHYHDDLESLFYVFMCICIKYRGPLGIKRDLSADRCQDWLPHQWAVNTLKEASDVKTSFFFHPNVHKLQQQFHPYFASLLPLAKQWYDLIRNKGPSSMVTFQEVINLLETHLDMLPKNEPSPELLFARRVIAALPQKRNASELEGDNWGNSDLTVDERNVIKTKGRMGWTMEVTPQLTGKRSRTT